jgi:hypothetical protein
MHLRRLSLLAALAFSPASLHAQHGAGAEPPSTRAPHEASQYDFLAGQWELAITPKVSGLVAQIHGVPKLRGAWKGARALDGWGEVDELRIADASGNPIAYTHFVRVYDPETKHWLISAVDVYRQRISTASAQLLNGEMLSVSDALDPEGKPYRSRTHITDITATSFHYSQDVSHDGGATWDMDHLVMEAKRTTSQ